MDRTMEDACIHWSSLELAEGPAPTPPLLLQYSEWSGDKTGHYCAREQLPQGRGSHQKPLPETRIISCFLLPVTSLRGEPHLSAALHYQRVLAPLNSRGHRTHWITPPCNPELLHLIEKILEWRHATCHTLAASLYITYCLVIPKSALANIQLTNSRQYIFPSEMVICFLLKSAGPRA